jgi:murein DD-endopeptidase MepM/ murein hydrolase activator NlpD
MTTSFTRRDALVTVVGVVGGIVLGGAAHAGSMPRAKPRAPTTTTTTTTASSDAPRSLRVSPGVARNGKIAVVDVVASPAAGALASLAASLGGRWGTTFPTSVDRKRWRALVPVDIEESAATLPFVADARGADGTTTTTTTTVRVQPGRYDHRAITVGKQFTSPSQAEQDRAARENEELAAAMRQSSTTRLWRGRFARPTAGPETAPFGTLRTYNKKRKSRHFGLDLDGEVGAPIVAANSGRVLLASERFYSGGTVLLDHGEGLMTMYFHMSRIDVVVGQDVDKRAPLGAIGASGQVTGPHLHLTVKLGGCSVDPAQLLALDLSGDVEGARASSMTPPTTP